MQQGRELRLAARTRVEPELVRDGEDEIDDVSAMAARVFVVRFNHFPEEQRCAAVRMGELESVIEPRLALPCEHLQQPDEREDDE